MEIVIAFVSSLATEVAKCMVLPFRRHIGYILNRKNNFEDFKKKAELLENERQRVKHAIDAAQRNGETIEEDVQNWLVRVDEKIMEAEKVIALEDKAKGKCFIGLCPNVKSYYQIGKKAQEDAKVVAELMEQGRFGRVSYCPAPEGIGTMPNKDYEAFQSRVSILEGIMEALVDPNLTVIGVFGMAGVGKTMLVNEVARKVREQHLFDEVVMATVSHIPNIRKIQGEIADMLGLRFDEESEPGRARRLRQRLRLHKRVLVILDDNWAKLDLDAIGISFEDDENIATDDKQGSIMENIGRNSLKKISNSRRKILLTSRNQDVLCHMNAEKKLECRILAEEEAMVLFAKIVGDIVSSPSYQPIANQVVKKCAGLPIAVSTIANALKNMSLDIWEDALRQLKRSNPTNIEGMEEGVYSIIELSYTFLKSKEAQSLFRLCALYPQGDDIHMSYLLRYNLGLDLLEGVNTLEEARRSVSALVHKLKASGLLLSGSNDGMVKMHDVVRDVSISIVSKHNQMFVIEEEVRMKDLLKKGKLNNCTALSLPYGDIHELPEVLECPKLKLLMLFRDNDHLKVPDMFFAKMNDLQVLDMIGMQFESLPSSFLSLTNLQTLCLDDCKLSDIAVIANFKKLDILTFRGSEIKQLPKEIGQLTQLRLLDLSYCALEVIPANIISSLSRLEELYMSNSFDRWDVEGNASLTELKYLNLLTTLEVQIRDIQILPKNLFSETLERYRIVLGKEWWDWSNDHKYSRILELELNTTIDWDCGIKMLLRRTEALYLNELKGVKSLLYELDDTGFQHLKNLHVQNNSEIQYIINSIHGISCEAFPSLESLFLQNMINLKKISQGHIYAECFRSLKFINVGNCDSLRNIFSFSLATQLFQLQEIEVTDCNNIVDIITADREDATDKIELPELRSMTLQRLPELITFCFEEKKPSISDQHGQIDNTCTSLPLFTEKIVFPKLETLKLSSINVERIWHFQLSNTSYSVQNLTSLIIEGCSNLKHIFSYSMAESLQQLRCLELVECKCIREIVSMEEIKEDGKRAAISFPRLNSLKLKGLQKLIRFCHGNCFLELPSLNMLEIEYCPELKGFINNSMGKDITIGSTEVLFNEKVAFPNLEKMTISHLRKVKRLWYNQLHMDSFCKLKVLRVEYCDELLNIFPSFLMGVFQRLERLEVTDCASLEEVFELQGLDIEEACVVNSQLRELYLFHLPKLKHVWNKDPHGNISFQNLRVVGVLNCWGLKNLFPFSIAKGLPQLESLTVNGSGVEEIVSKNEGSDQEIWFEFNQLSYLMLSSVTILKCFYPGVHTTAWPMLKTLRTFNCGKIKIFGQGESQIQQPLVMINKVIPQLEEVSFSSNDIAMICDGQFAKDFFCHIKSLSIIYYQNDSTVFPFCFLQSFYNLESLEIFYCNFKAQSPYKGEVGEEKIVFTAPLPKVKMLILNAVSKMGHLWRQDSPMDHICSNLETLKVQHCNGLIHLASASSSFQNLTILDVWDCKRMAKLITSSKAQSLVRLVTMRIRECEMMTEVITREGDEATYEIIFRELKCLELHCLQSLKSFCSGKCNFKFPSLEQVTVSQCPSLESFCQGALCTPKLQTVRLKDTNFKGRRTSDLNATVVQLHKEKVGYRGLNKLKLSEAKCPEMMDIWNKNPREILDLENLEFLEVCDSNNLRCIFSLSMTFSLRRLRTMEIKRCNKMEHVIKEATTDNQIIIIFPILYSIIIKSCPDLTSFCLGSPTLEFKCPSLEIIDIANCPNMTTFLSTFSKREEREAIGYDGTERNKDDIHTPLAFFSNKVISLVSFQNLRSLVLSRCNGLISLLTHSTVKSLVQLKTMKIIDCKMVEGIIACTSNEVKDDIIFTHLKHLRLSCLPNLANFCSGSYAIDFPSLEEVVVKQCPKMMFFSAGALSTPKLQGVKFTKGDDKGNWEGDLNITIEQYFKGMGVSKMGHLWKQDSPMHHICSSLETLQVWCCHNLIHLASASSVFQNLTTLNVWDCRQMAELITSSKAQSLVRLVTMSISECEMMTEVVTCEGDEATYEIIFRELKCLELHCLQSLKSFCSGKCNYKFPSLEQVTVSQCPSLESFCQGALCTPKLQTVRLKDTDFIGRRTSDLNATVVQLHKEKVGYRGLKKLKLSEAECPEMMDIWNRNPQEILDLENLEFLEVCDSNNLRCIFSLSMALNLSRLQLMNIKRCNKMEHVIEKAEGSVLEEETGDNQIIESCPDLTSFCLGNPTLEFKCPLLDRIEIVDCPNITTFVSTFSKGEERDGTERNKDDIHTPLAFFSDKVISLVSFQNLRSLVLSRCNGLISLLTHSTVKSLVQLETIDIIDCKMIEEIIACTSDEVKDGIIFTHLKYLGLSCLPNLANFCSGNYAIDFPSLEEVVVKQCPKMMIFSGGALNTPKLQGVKFTKGDDKGHWEGNLNTTIEQYFKGMVCIDLVDFPAFFEES